MVKKPVRNPTNFPWMDKESETYLVWGFTEESKSYRCGTTWG